LIEHAPPKLVGMVQFPVRSCRRLKQRWCGLSSFVLGVNEWVKEKGSRAVQSLTRYQPSIHHENSLSTLKAKMSAADQSW